MLNRDLENAKEDLDRCLAQLPDWTPARLRLATVLMHLGDMEKAGK